MKTYITSLFFVLFLPMYAEVLNDSQYLHQQIATIRHTETDKPQFRKSMQKIGEYLAIQAYEELDTQSATVETSLGVAEHKLLVEQPVLITIMRAGIPLLEGVQEVFPDAEVGFFAMSRNPVTFTPDVSYIALPDVKDKTVIICDPMVGTANSVNAAVDHLKERGVKKIIFLCVITSPEARVDPSVTVIPACIDPGMNENKYLVPGLGDAGDRSYGSKSY